MAHTQKVTFIVTADSVTPLAPGKDTVDSGSNSRSGYDRKRILLIVRYTIAVVIVIGVITNAIAILVIKFIRIGRKIIFNIRNTI